MTHRARLQRTSGVAVSGGPLVTAAPKFSRMTRAARGSPILRAASRSCTPQVPVADRGGGGRPQCGGRLPFNGDPEPPAITPGWRHW